MFNLKSKDCTAISTSNGSLYLQDNSAPFSLSYNTLSKLTIVYELMTEKSSRVEAFSIIVSSVVFILALNSRSWIHLPSQAAGL